MPLHFYGVNKNTRLDALKPDPGVTIENNHGATLYWRLWRKDTIREVKNKLATVQTTIPAIPSLTQTKRVSLTQSGTSNSSGISGTISYESNAGEVNRCQDGGRMSAEVMRLYLITDDENDDDGDRSFWELHDDETVEKYKIKDDDRLFLLSYTWNYESNVTVTKTGRKLQGAEPEDTCLGIKLRAQDQLGVPVQHLKVFEMGSGKPLVEDVPGKVKCRMVRNP